MRGFIEINDNQFDKLVKESIDTALKNVGVENLIETKIAQKVDKLLKEKLSDEKISNYTRDRISRILTTESLKDFTFGIDAKDVLANVEEKIILMIKNSKEFKTLVKQTMKNSL